MNIDATPIFEKNYNSDKFITINRGGTRSSKTWSIAQIMMLWLFTGKYSANRPPVYKGVWTTARQFSSSLDASVIRDFEEILNEHEVFGKVKHDKTRKTYAYGKRLVEFIGTDDAQKLRGPKRNILYCNEANELEYDTQFFQLLMRTSDKIFLDFNPDDEDIWINTKLEQKRLFERGDVDVVVSSYKDNTFLAQRQVEEIDALESDDPEKWEIYGLGNYGKVRGLIFNNWKIVADLPRGEDGQLLGKKVGVGLDFGFTNDPTAVLDVYLHAGELWVSELIYERRHDNNMIAARLKQLGITPYEEIIADSAEPKSIQEIYNLQFNIKPALKGPDSVVNSIDILKRYKINITAWSVNVIKEFKKYKWAVDKNGNSLQEPVDKDNHAMDALRYIALNKLAHNNSGVYNIR